MSQNIQLSLSNQFASLLEERAKNWEPERLAKNAADRRALVDRFDPSRIAQIGEKIGDLAVMETSGNAVRLKELVSSGPAVIIFFRYGECPACNIALPYYDQRLRPALEAAGVALIAVSPQLPDRLLAFKQRRNLDLRIASDPDNRLARRLGITFIPDEIPEGPPPADWIGELTGTGTWELPQPSVAILEQDLTLRHLLVSPDWLDRPEAEDILDRAVYPKDRRAA